jgi:hypothetical protein
MSPRTWTIELPYTSPPLRDNDRHHWARKAELVRGLRADAKLMARFVGVPTGLSLVGIVLHWQPATRRRRDQLSIAPTLKPLVDGLVDYGLIPDDDTTHCELSCRIEPVAKPARVWLEITDLTVDLSAVPANPNGADQ